MTLLESLFDEQQGVEIRPIGGISMQMTSNISAVIVIQI
jgi:hypothetical protein